MMGELVVYSPHYVQASLTCQNTQKLTDVKALTDTNSETTARHANRESQSKNTHLCVYTHIPMWIRTIEFSSVHLTAICKATGFRSLEFTPVVYGFLVSYF